MPVKYSDTNVFLISRDYIGYTALFYHSGEGYGKVVTLCHLWGDRRGETAMIPAGNLQENERATGYRSARNSSTVILAWKRIV